jgi:DNA recombination protein RmuC
MEEPMIVALAVVAVLLLVALAVVLVRGEQARAKADANLHHLAETSERLASAQAELMGRMGQSQNDTNQRLESLTQRLGEGLNNQTEKTGESLLKLQERLAVIDAAQKNITDLSQQVVGLQDILSNKQARGAFGELQLNDLVRAILPPSAYSFQARLSNGRVADCLLVLPNPPGPIVIDAKFPLESFRALSASDDEDTRRRAARDFGAAIIKHVHDVRDRYIVPGETAESALMFLPSEAVYAELHANHADIVDRSFRARVWIVSPTTLMATLNTVRAVLKDVRMREQAGVIQDEVHKMMGDVGRLDKRVENLQRHFSQADNDVREIRTSAGKIISRGERIEEVQLGDDGAEETALVPPPAEAASS